MSNSLERYNLRTKYFFRDMYGEPFVLTQGQKELFDLIYNPEILRASIKAMSQYGKSDVASMAIIMTMIERIEKILILAPSEKQAAIIMGKVIMHFFDNPYLTQMIETSGRLEQLKSERSKKRLTTKNRSEVMILTANAEEVHKQAKNLIGFGASIVIVDERPLIPDEIFSKILRMVGGAKRGKIVMLGNAFADSEQFKKAFLPNSRYKSLSIDYKQALAEGRVTQDFLEEAKEDMTPMDWQIFYEMVFPETGSDDALIPMSWIQLAVNQKGCEGEAKQSGLDVARFGKDRTIFIFRQGGVVKPEWIKQTEQMDTMEVSGWAFDFLNEFKPDIHCTDAVGVGGGVADRLEELQYSDKSNFKETSLQAINVGESPTDDEKKKKFLNLRAEAYWNLRELFKPNKEGRSSISIPDDPELKKELSEIRYGYSSEKKIKIEPKEEMKKRLGVSPDKADALALAFCTIRLFVPSIAFA